MPKVWRILLTLSCALALFFLLWRSPPKELSDLLSTTTEAPIYPSSYLQGVQTKQYDKQGKLSYILHAETIAYFDKNKAPQAEVTLDQPHLTLFSEQDNEAPWLVSSKRAEGSENQDELMLIGDVIIQQTQENGQQTQLATPELLIRPSRRYAETDKPVIITDETGITQAKGLKVFFDEKRIELLSNVTGEYQNPQQIQP